MHARLKVSILPFDFFPVVFPKHFSQWAFVSCTLLRCQQLATQVQWQFIGASVVIWRTNTADYIMYVTCSLVWYSFAFCQWSGGNLALFDWRCFFGAGSWGKNILRKVSLTMSFNVVEQTRVLFTNGNHKIKGNLPPQKKNYRSRPYTDNPIPKTRFLNQLPVNSNWIPDGAWTPSSQLSERVSARCQAS